MERAGASVNVGGEGKAQSAEPFMLYKARFVLPHDMMAYGVSVTGACVGAE